MAFDHVVIIQILSDFRRIWFAISCIVSGVSVSLWVVWNNYCCLPRHNHLNNCFRLLIIETNNIYSSNSLLLHSLRWTLFILKFQLNQLILIMTGWLASDWILSFWIISPGHPLRRHCSWSLDFLQFWFVHIIGWLKSCLKQTLKIYF